MEYRREVDGLRAVAVLPVILFHAGSSLFSGGYVGVDIFFVISGYLISSIIIKDIENKTFSIYSFYERRARRILPALFVVMIFCILLGWIILLPNDFKELFQSIFSVSIFSSNILFFIKSGYFDTSSEFKPLLHTWSLAVEEQFYLFFPLLLMLFRSNGRLWTNAVLFFLFAASFAAAEWASYSNPAAAFYLLPTRAWELLLGVFAAIYLAKVPRLPLCQTGREFAGYVGISMIFGAIFAYTANTPFPGIYALLPTVGTLLVIIFVNEQTHIGKILGSRVLVGVGLVSYSAYLWHQPIFAFSRHLGVETASLLTLVLLCALTFALAYLTWRYIEQPFRTRSKFSRRSIFWLSFAASVAFLAIGYVGHKAEGFPWRFKRSLSGDVGQTEFHQYIDEKYLDCEPREIASQALVWESYLRCKQSKKGIPNIVLLGDSHAEHLFLGLAEHQSKNNVAFYILDGKPYLRNPQYKTIFRQLAAQKNPQTILLTMNYSGRLNDKNSDLFQGFSETIRYLKGLGKKVVIVGDTPVFSTEPGHCIYKTRKLNSINECNITLTEFNLQKNRYNGVLKNLSTIYDIKYVSIDNAICDKYKCSMIYNDSVIFRDKNHLNIIGSKLIGNYLANKI